MEALKKANRKQTIFNTILVILLLTVCIIFIINPKEYASSCLDAISVWAIHVLPVLFPFFICARLIINLVGLNYSPMDKFFKKLYHTPTPSFLIFVLSCLSGYPMGAKLIASAYEQGAISKTDAKKILSFTSVSGPMFVIGTVGVGFMSSVKVGVLILVSNILASLINGFIYRGKISKSEEKISLHKNSNVSLSDTVYDSLISILMIGGFIVISFLLVDILTNLKILNYLCYGISHLFFGGKYQDIIFSSFCGLFEVTRGCLATSACACPLSVKAIISSVIVSFGGLSIILQTSSLTSKIGISTKYVILQKITQSIITLIIVIPLSLIIF